MRLTRACFFSTFAIACFHFPLPALPIEVGNLHIETKDWTLRQLLKLFANADDDANAQLNTAILAGEFVHEDGLIYFAEPITVGEKSIWYCDPSDASDDELWQILRALQKLIMQDLPSERAVREALFDGERAERKRRKVDADRDAETEDEDGGVMSDEEVVSESVGDFYGTSDSLSHSFIPTMSSSSFML
jgi:hypothetical protein